MTRLQLLVLAIDVLVALAASFGWGYMAGRRRWYERGFRAGATRSWPRWLAHREKS